MKYTYHNPSSIDLKLQIKDSRPAEGANMVESEERNQRNDDRGKGLQIDPSLVAETHIPSDEEIAPGGGSEPTSVDLGMRIADLKAQVARRDQQTMPLNKQCCMLLDQEAKELTKDFNDFPLFENHENNACKDNSRNSELAKSKSKSTY